MHAPGAPYDERMAATGGCGIVALCDSLCDEWLLQPCLPSWQGREARDSWEVLI